MCANIKFNWIDLVNHWDDTVVVCSNILIQNLYYFKNQKKKKQKKNIKQRILLGLKLDILNVSFNSYRTTDESLYKVWSPSVIDKIQK